MRVDAPRGRAGPDGSSWAVARWSLCVHMPMARTQEGKSIAISSGFLDELKVHAIMDLSLGSGALLEAALSRGILYHGLCRNRPRMNWPQGIADRASCGLIATEGSSLLSSELL